MTHRPDRPVGARPTARRLYVASSVLAGIIGLAHTVTGLLSGSPLTQARMWFVGSGLYMVLSAALGSLDASWPGAPRQWRLIVRGNHWLILAFAIVTGLLGRPSVGEWLVVGAAFGGMALLAPSDPT